MLNFTFKEIFGFVFKVMAAIVLTKAIIGLIGLGIVAALQAIPQ